MTSHNRTRPGNTRRPDAAEGGARELSAAERTHGAIREGIIDGTYPAGTLLSENELAAAIGVSRTPVRAALARLREDGWIIVYPQRGALVRSLTSREIRDIADARLTLESAGVARADTAQRVKLAADLVSSVEQQRQALTDADVPTFIALTIAFHRSFVGVGENAYLIDVSRRLGDRQRQLLFSERDRLLRRADGIIAEHQTLLDRLANDDPVGFAAVLRQHLVDTHEIDLGQA